MKLKRTIPGRRPGERGFFLVVVLLIIASLMLIYITANGGRLITLRKEIHLVEQKQIERLNRSHSAATNTVAAIPVVTAK